jgi:hypothetical protein
MKMKAKLLLVVCIAVFAVSAIYLMTIGEQSTIKNARELMMNASEVGEG